MRILHEITGEVLHGKKRGKNLGFPTINQTADSKLEEGLYLSQTTLQNQTYNSLTFIGPAKTFEETETFVETYILDFDKDVYGEIATVKIFKKLRGNVKFESVEKLIKQMKQDESEAREFFLSNSHNSSV